MQNNRDRSGRMVGGAALIILGVLFLLDSIVPGFSVWSIAWPFFIIVPGVLMFIPVLTGTSRSAGMAVPASMVTGTGLILLYQNISGYWESWVYIWTLYLAFLGVGLFLTGRIEGKERVEAHGRVLIRCGLLSFVAVGVFFEVFVFGSGGAWWPVLLIGAGVWMLLRSLGVSLPQLFHTSARTGVVPPAPAVDAAAVRQAEASADRAAALADQLGDTVQTSADIAAGMVDVQEDLYAHGKHTDWLVVSEAEDRLNGTADLPTGGEDGDDPTPEAPQD